MATKDCTFFVDVNGRQVEMDFDGFRAYLMEEAGLAQLAPDLFKKRGKKARFTTTRAEATPARAEAAPVKAEAVPARAEAAPSKPAKGEKKETAEKGVFKVTNTALREIFNVSKDQATGIMQLAKAMGIDLSQVRLARGEIKPIAGEGLEQRAVTSKMDAEYMAAVKAGDTAKAQKMVDEAAKAAGYNETGSHGLAEGKLESHVFDMARLGRNTRAASAKLGFFFASKDTAGAYSDISLNEKAADDVAQQARRIISPLLRSVPEGVSRELDYARDNLETLFSVTSKDRYEPESYVNSVQREVARFITEAEYVTDMLDDEAAEKTDAEKQRIREAIEQAQKQYEVTLSEVPDSSVVKTGAVVDAVLQMQNPFVYDQKGRTYREQTYYDIIKKAKEQGHDSVIIKNTYDGGPLDDIKVVFKPSQIKSADPITYNNKGNVIPLSERFRPETPDIRYQMGKKAQMSRADTPIDAEYMAAVKAGDTARAQKMVDGAAKAAGYDYAGWRAVSTSPSRQELESRSNSYVTADRDAAQDYKLDEDYVVQRVHVKRGDTLTLNNLRDLTRLLPDADIDVDGYVFEELDKTRIRTAIWEKGYNAVDFPDVSPDNIRSHRSILLKNSGSIKSADPITYDDKGNVIPLSERFRPETPDIRYQMGYHAARGLFKPEPRFPNGRFRLDKVGTGMGGQAYGWGIYLAPERPGATSYYDTLKAESPDAVLYELDVPDDVVAKLLDFDKPVPVKQRVAINRELKAQGVDLEIDASISLGEAIEQIQDVAFPDSEGYAKLTSELLDRAGIPGLQVSAYAEKRPYVIWNQAALDQVALLKANEKTLGEISKASSPPGSIVSMETETGTSYWYAAPEEAPQGLITFLDREDKRMANGVLAVIRGFSAANVSTPIHELFHFYRRFLLNEENGFTAAEITAFENWAGAKDGVWSTEADEKAARGFERYLRNGQAPSDSLKKLFKRIAEWMRSVYQTLRGSAIDIDISPEASRVYDRIFTLAQERQRKPDATVTKVRRGSKTLYQTEITPKEGPVYTDNILEAMKKWSPKGTVEQLKAHLSKFKGAIAEANWIGLPVFLEGRNRVTRAEVEQFVKDNEISIQEVLLGEPGAPPESRARFGAYTLEPSGENYRELLLTIKPQSPRLIQTATGQRVYEPSTQQLSRTMDAVAAERELGRLLSVPTPTFVQPRHYPTPNIVVHVRFNERTMADGNKVLFLEEIQSDWAQAWRQERASRAATPFEDTPVWTALAFKRMLRWATDTGFDKIAWTTGRMQARRWHQTVTVTDTPRTDIESIEFTKVQRFLSTDPNAWDLTVRLLNGKEERYQAITTDTLKEEFGNAIANEIVRVARSIPGGMQPGQKRTISPPSGRQNATEVRVSMFTREEEVGWWDSDDTWSVPVLVVTETGPDGRVTTIELDPLTTAVDYFGERLLERILTQPAFDDYFPAVLEAHEGGRPEPPAPELVLSQEDLASIEATREATRGTTQQASQIANAMMTYYDTIIPKEIKKLIKPFGGTVTTERLESGQTVHTVSVTDKMKAQARQGQVLFQREGEGVPKEQTATEAYRKYQQEQRQKNVQAAFARLRQQTGAAKPTEPEAQTKAPKAKKPPEAKAASATAPRPPREPRAATTEAKRGFGNKTLDEIFSKLVEDAKAGKLPRQTTPSTEAERLEERIQRALRDVVVATYGSKVLPETVATEARDLAEAMLAAQAKGDTAAFEAAEQAFKTLTAGARRAMRPQPAPRPAKTLNEQLEDMIRRAQKPGQSASADLTAMAKAEVARQARQFKRKLKIAIQQGQDVKMYLENVTINGVTRSRLDLFLLGAEEFEKGFIDNNPLLQQQGQDKMRQAIDSITSVLTHKTRPRWHATRSPLSYANVIGSYEALMGPLGKRVSDEFKLVHSAVARGTITFGRALNVLEEVVNTQLVPQMIAQGYLGMPRIIREHIEFIRKTAAFSARATMARAEGSVFKNPSGWYAARRDLYRDFGFAPLASFILKSTVYDLKLRFNVKSAATNFFQLALSAGPYLTADEFVRVVNDSLKPSTWKREVAPGVTLRAVAVGETGGRQVEGAPDLSAESKWWHRIDVFQVSSDHVRVAAYLVGEIMAERLSAKFKADTGRELAPSAKALVIRDWVEKVEFDNSPWNRAPLFRGAAADVLLQFKPFLQKNVERMIADLQRNPTGFIVRPARTPVGKLIQATLPPDVRRVVKLLSLQVSFGGVSSLLTAIPGLKTIGGVLILAGVINMFRAMGMDEDEAEELAIGIYYGAPAAIGIDLSATVGFFDEPFGKDVYEQIISYFLGPSVGSAANVVKRTLEYTKAAQEAPKLGREKEKAKEVQERLLKIPAAATPYVRMYGAAQDLVTGTPTTIRLQEEIPLSKTQQIIQALGGSPIEQTMFFDAKEAYGWQNRLMGKPTGYERVKPKPGESNEAYFKRAAVAETLTSQYLPELQRNPQFQQMSPADQAAVLDNLSRNITEESGKARPDRQKLRARNLIRNRKQTIREQQRNARRQARARGFTP